MPPGRAAASVRGHRQRRLLGRAGLRDQPLHLRDTGAAIGAGLEARADFGGGIYRAASFVGDRIETCLFVGPARDAGDWEVVKGLFALDALDDAQRRMLLSGRSSEGLASTGPIVCACFGVGKTAISDAIAQGARTPAEIGARVKAGTNCGSCIPEMKRLIAQAGAAEQPALAVSAN